MKRVLVLALVAGVVGLSLYGLWPSPAVEGPRPATPAVPSEVAEPAALWIGDSFTEGFGGKFPRRDGYACVASRAMGWTCNLDAQGGTGFINNGRINVETYVPFKDRILVAREKYLADVIIVDGGRNDGHKPVNVVAAAAEKYLLKLRKLWPKAEIVAIAPFFLGSTPESYGFSVAFTVELKKILAKVDGHLIDPMGEGWIPPKNIDRLYSEDKVHPNNEGYEYIADHLTKGFRRLGLAGVKVTDKRGPAFETGTPSS